MEIKNDGCNKKQKAQLLCFFFEFFKMISAGHVNKEIQNKLKP